MLAKVLPAALLFTAPLFSFTLSPQTPVPIITNNTAASGVSVAGSSSGFLAAWKDSFNNAVASFSSNNGQTWSSPVFISNDVSHLVRVSAQESKFLSGWVDLNETATGLGDVKTSVSTDSGQTWTMPVLISTAPSAGPTVATAATSAGFMAVWTQGGMALVRPLARFSANGTSWDAAVQLSSLLIKRGSTSVAGNSAGFLATFQEDAGPNYFGYASFTGNNGASWSMPVQVAAMRQNEILSVAANGSGFLGAWISPTNQLLTSFSTTNGASWSAPVEIPTTFTGLTTILGLSGGDAGFVITWVNGGPNIFASFSSDRGATWSAPVQLITSPAVKGLTDYVVGVSIADANCMFTWWNTANNAISSYSTLPSPSASSSSPLFQQISPNNPGKTLFR